MRTRDHSAVQLLMDLGEIDESEMATHPAQNRLYRCLGGEDRPKPDLGQLRDPARRSAGAVFGWRLGTSDRSRDSGIRTRTSGPATAARLLTARGRATRRRGRRQRHADPVARGCRRRIAGHPGCDDWSERFASLLNRTTASAASGRPSCPARTLVRPLSGKPDDRRNQRATHGLQPAPLPDRGRPGRRRFRHYLQGDPRSAARTKSPSRNIFPPSGPTAITMAPPSAPTPRARSRPEPASRPATNGVCSGFWTKPKSWCR